ncbi:MAG: asparagine synthase (glutamine-hydrolyzing), partial [Syntrophomonadaceae bacterium]|nr:asparagine synthase (glutamine-hydrolyzing) [Syntrophomonadaceae bacterium]
MCGIAGVIGDFDSQRGMNIIGRMGRAIRHRGPDDNGDWSKEGIALTMQRLSIIDLTGGHQPMWDGGNGIIFNGEIYNYLELRRELERKGCSFKTRSDTEVILQLYCVEGINGLKKLRGMFAICILDLQSQRLFLIRDRIGIKPLYYGTKTNFYFASEIKSIIAGMESRPELNMQAVHHYLTLRYVPAPETIWHGIFKLPPGCCLEYDLRNNTWEVYKYWSVQFKSQEIDVSRDYTKEFEDLFLAVVEQHLVTADVPVGVMLSGGLDSSVLSAVAVELGHRNFHTFSVGFKGAEDINEFNYAREVSRQILSEHHEVSIDKDDFFEFIPQLVFYSDEPLADLTAVPLYYLSMKAKEQVKVVLSGEGSDEILAGYDMEKLAQQ